ncbi:hypothetical protein Bca52824_059687 [Brassica carinata]|uniref:Uncharacterized protein n=1 Tax=Brassica carinata TaxID=52824 RepID=A0A8X7QVZ6_BRACI|nr:hypothetical protein Bca52824_059687 [Brassica carinata]
MTNDNNTPIDTTDVTTTSINVAATDATVTTAGNITANHCSNNKHYPPCGNAADETTHGVYSVLVFIATGSVSATASATDATVTTAGNITASTAAATTSTILPAGNAADETTRRCLFGAGLYQTGSVSATASGPVAV